MKVFLRPVFSLKNMTKRLFKNRCLFHDRSARASKISSSGKSASFTELIYVFMRSVEPSIACLVTFCTLSFRDCIAAVFSVDANSLKNSKDGFLKTHTRSVVCSSVYTPLRNSNNGSDSGLNRVS